MNLRPQVRKIDNRGNGERTLGIALHLVNQIVPYQDMEDGEFVTRQGLARHVELLLDLWTVSYTVRWTY